MATSYPVELKERAVGAYLSHEESMASVARQFRIAEKTLERWVKRFREEGVLSPRPRGGGYFSPVLVGTLMKVMEAYPNAVSEELTREYNRRVDLDFRVHRSSILRCLHRLDFVFKKKDRRQRSAFGRTLRKNERAS